VQAARREPVVDGIAAELEVDKLLTRDGAMLQVDELPERLAGPLID
jgi:hypothetical protein